MEFNKEALYDLIENETKLTKIGSRMVRKDCYMGYPSLAIAVIESIGGEILDDFDTNGWQYDYWIPFMLNEKRYTIEGTGYYGTINRVFEENIEELAQAEKERQEVYAKLTEEASKVLELAESLNL